MDIPVRRQVLDIPVRRNTREASHHLKLKGPWLDNPPPGAVGADTFGICVCPTDGEASSTTAEWTSAASVLPSPGRWNANSALYFLGGSANSIFLRSKEKRNLQDWATVRCLTFLHLSLTGLIPSCLSQGDGTTGRQRVPCSPSPNSPTVLVNVSQPGFATLRWKVYRSTAVKGQQKDNKGTLWDEVTTPLN